MIEPPFSTDDTIAAISTPLGRGGIGIVRLSGRESRGIVGRLFEPAGRHTLEPRRATFGRLRHGLRGLELDQVLVTFFQSPRSYTGEDVCEISGHGSPLLLTAILEATLDEGARLARPGEFTLRAYLNGRLDLVQAEAVADLIEAVTPAQAHAALGHLEGRLTRRIEGLSARLFDLAARLEASLDFPEEGYHFAPSADVASELGSIAGEVRELVGSFERGRILREGRRVAIAGRPNVGKSSVFNRLLESERAIVTAIPGTTRDVLVESANVGGVPIRLLDTAGVRDTRDPVEVEGVARARQTAREADVVLLVIDGSTPLEPGDRTLYDAIRERRHIVVINKIDRPGAWPAGIEPRTFPGSPIVRTSALDGTGLDDLRQTLAQQMLGGEELRRDELLVTNVRHARLLESAAGAVGRAQDAAAAGLSEEFVLIDLHAARQAVEAITGTRTVDDLLNHIFANFCIGK